MCLKTLKKLIPTMDVPETDFGNIAKSPESGIFSFRALLQDIITAFLNDDMDSEELKLKIFHAVSGKDAR